MKHRSEGARLIKDGLVLVDGAPAKPAATVRPGQRIRVETPRSLREWEVLEIPEGSVRKSERARYARLLDERSREP